MSNGPTPTLPQRGGSSEYHRFKTAHSDRYKMLKEYAKENRNNMTDAERLLWNYIKDRRNGMTFRRQHIIGDYICDFACLKQKLIIEVDGGYHSQPEQIENDALRQSIIEDYGFRFIRFTNDEIFMNLDEVLKKIYNNK